MTTFRWLVVPFRGAYAMERHNMPPKRGHWETER